MERNGWIRLHRSIMDHWIWTSHINSRRWLDILLMSSWDDCTVMFLQKRVVLKRGQLVTSMRTLEKLWGTNAKTVLRFLHLLESEGMITTVRSKERTIITVCNYEKYQGLGVEDNNQKQSENFVDSLNGLEHQGQYIEKNNILNNNIIQTISRENDENFFEELKSQSIFLETCAMDFSCEVKTVKKLLTEFFKEITTLEKWHCNFHDFRDHFYRWSRNNIIKNKNGAKQKTGNSASEDKYSTRRGTDPGSLGKQDFNSDF